MFFKKLHLKFFLIFVFLSGSIFAAVDFSEEEDRTNETQTQVQTIKATSGTKTVNKKLQLAENNPIAAMLCKIIRAFTGTIAKVLALFLIIGLGITIFMATSVNPVSPVTLVGFVLGIGLLFSAEFIVGRLMGDAGQGGGNYKKSCDCKYGLEDDCEEFL